MLASLSPPDCSSHRLHPSEEVLIRTELSEDQYPSPSLSTDRWTEREGRPLQLVTPHLEDLHSPLDHVLDPLLTGPLIAPGCHIVRDVQTNFN